MIKIPFIKIGILICALSLMGCASVQTRADVLNKARLIKERLELGGPIERTYETTHEDLKMLPITEKLTYKAKYLGMTMGMMTSEIKGTTRINGRPAYHFEMTARTTPFFSKIFNVEDRFVAYMDTETHNVLRQEVYRKEGNYRKEAIVDFNYDENKAYFHNRVDDSRKVVDIPDRMHDVVTANYYFRMIPWELGDIIDMNIYADEEIYGMIGLISEQARISIPFLGRKVVYVFEPYTFDGNEEVKKTSARGFFDRDDPRIPLRGLIKTPLFGSASVTLHDKESSDRLARE